MLVAENRHHATALFKHLHDLAKQPPLGILNAVGFAPRIIAVLGDEQHATLARHCPDPPQVPLRRGNHPRRTLHKRLDDDGGQFVSVLPHQPGQFINTSDLTRRPLQPKWAAVAMGARRSHDRK